MKGNIHSIETFGTVDGPGIRYVVFLQGCPLRCQYCHNPDTWQASPALGMSSDEILAEYASYAAYLKNGGITCSGGEPLLQIDFIIDLFTKAKAKNIHTCLDTSGITFSRENPRLLAKFNQLLKVTDLILLDIKHIQPDAHLQLTGKSNHSILDFATYLSEMGQDVWIRHVVVPELTNQEDDLYQLGYFLGSLKNIKALDVLPYHTMGKSKYDNLGLVYPLKDVPALSAQDTILARNQILKGMRQRLRENLT